MVADHLAIKPLNNLHQKSKIRQIIFITILFTFTLSLITITHGQVKIKEKVEIKPRTTFQNNKSQSKPTTEEYNLRIICKWEQTYLGANQDIPMSRMRFKISLPFCGEKIYSDFDYTGNLTYELTELKGTTYDIEVLVSQRSLWDSVYRDEGPSGYNFDVYVDNEYVKSADNYLSVTIEPWFGLLGIDIGSAMNYYEYGKSVNLYTSTACKPIIGRMNEDLPTITIIKGEEYLAFYHETSDDTLGDSFYSGDYINNELPILIYDKPYYKSAELNAIIMAEVNGVTAFDTIKVLPVTDFELIVNMDPDLISTSEESNIYLQQQTYYGIEDFPPEQLFNIEIIEGANYGTILSTNGIDTADTYTQIEQGFKFRANEEIDIDSVEVLIKVTTEIEDEIAFSVENIDEDTKQINIKSNYKNNQRKKNLANNRQTRTNSSNDKIAPNGVFIPPGEKREIFGIGSVKIKKDNAIEIMLGETKYFGVKKKGNEENYKIEEVETNYGEEPKYTDDTNEEWKWIKNDEVWGSEPIEKLGTKSGVYWEKKWFDKTDNRNKDLEAGMIRLIGRFWEEGKEDSFKIKLKSTQNTEVEVKVIKPAKLLSDGQSPTYAKARDVHNKEYSIDSLCFYYGGKYGVPPQMIKGQMLQESSKKDFGGSTGWGFAPSYRYEPYTTQFYGVVKDILKLDTNPFIVTLEPNKSMGKPGASSVPTKLEHQHLEFSNNFGNFFHYIEDAKSVWDVIKEKSKIVNINNIYSTYGFQYEGTEADTLKKGQIKSGVYSIVDNTYLDFLKGKKIKGDKDGKREGGYEKIIKDRYGLYNDEELSRAQQTEANDSARAALIRLFINKYDKIPAQTRIAASYGLLQTTYPTVYKDHKYPTRNTDKPENLNEVDTNMVYSMKHYEKLFKYNGFPLDEKNSNWVSSKNEVKNSDGIILFEKPSAGYEEALKVMYYLWNSELKNKAGTKAIYHTEVLDKSELFLPRRK